MDNCAGKWQQGEAFTHKWWRVRKAKLLFFFFGGGGGGNFRYIIGCKQRGYVWHVLVTTLQPYHMPIWEGKKGKTSLFPNSVVMASGCSASWHTHSQPNAKPIGWFPLNWERKQLSSGSSLLFIFYIFVAFFWPSSPPPPVKNSHPQTPCRHPILLWHADNEQAGYSTMAAALQETTEDTKEGVEQQRAIIEIMAIKNTADVRSHSSKRAILSPYCFTVEGRSWFTAQWHSLTMAGLI